MNNRMIPIKCIALLVFTLVLVIAFFSISFSGPGTSDDPIVSLSYLEMATRFGEIQLRKSEELLLPYGSAFILFDGAAELRGVGDYYLIDLTKGKKLKRGKDILENHLYVVTGGSDIKIVAKKDVKVLVKGSDSGPSRKAMN